MPDILLDISEIRARLSSGSVDGDERLARAAQAYRDACREANARLTRCAELVSRGLRTEAISLAQADPDLLDQVAVLDFPGSDRWPVEAAQHKLPVPPRLLYRCAELLNRAYAEERPLEGLLQRHRELALARAPLAERASVLRQLASTDQANPVWADDTRLFENAVFDEMRAGLRAARKAGDHERVAGIHRELRETKWLEPIPIDLADAIAQAAVRASRELARGRLPVLEVNLEKAIAAENFPEARRLYDEAKKAISEARLRDDDADVRRIGDLFSFLTRREADNARQSEFEEALRSLESLLASSGSAKQIAESYQRALDLGVGSSSQRAIPPELERECRNRLELLRRRRHRKSVVQLIAAGIAVTILLAGGVIWLIESSARRQLDSAAEQMRQFIESRDLTAARTYYRDLSVHHPGIAESAEIKVLAQRLERAEEESKQRSQEFARILIEARKQPEETSPDAPIFTQLLRLASTPIECDAAARVIAEKGRAYQKLRERIEGAAAAKIVELQQEFDRLGEPTNEESLHQAREVLKQVSTALRPLRKEQAFYSQELRTRIDRLGTSLESKTKEIDEAQRSLAALPPITTSLIGPLENLTAYDSALRAYITAFPDAVRSRSFVIALREKAFWEAAIAWDRFLSTSTGRRLAPDVETANKLIERWDTLTGENDELFPADAGLVTPDILVQYRAALLGVLGRDPKGGKLITELNALFARGDVNGLWIVKATGGRTYYLAENPATEIERVKQNAAPRFQFTYLTDAAGAKATKLLKPDEIESHGAAPQSQFVAQALLDIKFLTLENWDATVVSLLERILGSKETDPILKVMLARRLIDIGGKGDPGLSAALTAHRTAIAEAKLDLSVPWMNPERPDAAQVRKAATVVVRSLPALDTVKENAAKRRRELETEIGQTRKRVAGWLLGEGEGRWRCVPVTELSEKRRLLVYSPGPEKGGEWVVVGHVKGKEVSLDASASQHFREGRLVFVGQE